MVLIRTTAQKIEDFEKKYLYFLKSINLLVIRESNIFKRPFAIVSLHLDYYIVKKNKKFGGKKLILFAEKFSLKKLKGTVSVTSRGLY